MRKEGVDGAISELVFSLKRKVDSKASRVVICNRTRSTVQTLLSCVFIYSMLVVHLLLRRNHDCTVAVTLLKLKAINIGAIIVM